MQFLKLVPGSRSISLGESFTGISDDVNALYFNPAGLLQSKIRQILFSHNELYQNFRNDFIGFIEPKQNYTLGASITVFYTQNDFEERSGLSEHDPYNPLTQPESYFSSKDISLQFSYARNLLNKLCFGTSIKLLHETIQMEKAYSTAIDIGTMYNLNKKIKIGATVKNFGLPLKYISKSYGLPLSINTGVMYKINNKLLFDIDINQPIDDYTQISIGGEFSPLKFLSLRFGYKYKWFTEDLLTGLAFGTGFNIKNFYIDYAMLPRNTIGDITNHISVGFKFDYEHKHKKSTSEQIKQSQNYILEGPLNTLNTIQIPQQENDKNIKIELIPIGPNITLYSVTKQTDFIKMNFRLNIPPQKDMYINIIDTVTSKIEISTESISDLNFLSTVYRIITVDTNLENLPQNVSYDFCIPKQWIIENNFNPEKITLITVQSLPPITVSLKCINEDNNNYYYRITNFPYKKFYITK